MSNKANEIIQESRKKIVEKIIENMERGDLIFNKTWDSKMMMPQNPVSKVNYLGGNRIRLIAETMDKGYKDPRWLTFKQAEANGWNVRKGEKGTLCEKWIFSKLEKGIDENGNTIEKEIKLDRPIANYFYVFNAEQIENIPKLEINYYSKDEKNEIIEDFINSSECKIKEVAQGKAFYNPIKDEIVLPSREAFKSQEDFLATAFHEMVHSTGHESRLNRENGMSSKFGSKEYAREELLAELGSVFLQSKLGVKLEGQHFDNHSAYLKSWIEILKNDPNELFRAAVQAEKATERLHERYLEYEKEKINNLVKSAENLKPHALDSFSIHFHYAETGKDTEHLNFNEEEKKYKGIKAYEFIEKVIKFDKEYSEKREIDETLGYYKSWVSINLKGYSTDKIRIDLGDKEFGGFEKVSDALEHRLKSFPKDLIEHKKEYADSYGISSETIEKDANEILEKIDKSISHFREKEQIYLSERKKELETDVEKDKSERNISESIKKEIKDNPNISKDELLKKIGIEEKQLSEEIGKLIKNKELFYTNDKGEIKYYSEKSDYIKDIQEREKQKEIAKEERKKELENLIKETVQKDIPKDNYNVLTGNPIIAENHLSGDKRWIAVSDVRKENISVKESEKPMLSVVLHKEEERLYAKPIEYYNISQLNITKELEQKFVPMKDKTIEKSKDKEIER